MNHSNNIIKPSRISQVTGFTKPLVVSSMSLFALLSACGRDGNKMPVAETQQPNIVFILTDDLGYGDLGCYGQQTLKTPHIDQLASDGIRFTQFYAGSPVCAPSRASLMTGRDSGHCRVRGNYETGKYGFGGELELLPSDVTLAEVLKREGYQTAMIGKWGLGMNGSTGEPDKKGFDFYYGYLNQAHAHSQFPDYLFRSGKKELIEENSNGKRNRFSNDIFTNEAINYIKDNSGKPFFLYLAYVTPHAEMLVPHDSIWNRFKGHFKETPYMQSFAGSNGKDSLGIYHSQPYPETAFASMITHIDNDVFRVLNELKKNGLEKNTIVMFSSDNGPHVEGGHSAYYFDSNGKYRGIKRDVYEGGIRVPFIVRWPGKIKPDQVTGQLSAFWDILPTMANIVNVDISDVKTEGYSLLPTLLGESAEQKQHDYFYWEFHENDYSDQAVRKGKWKAVRHDPARPLELYDLEKDPTENFNVCYEFPEIVKEMEQIMDSARIENPYFPLKSSSPKEGLLIKKD